MEDRAAGVVDRDDNKEWAEAKEAPGHRGAQENKGLNRRAMVDDEEEGACVCGVCVCVWCGARGRSGFSASARRITDASRP